MDCGGSPDRGGKDAAQIKEPNGLAKSKDDKRRRVASSVDSSSALEDLRGTRINIRGAVEDRSALLGRRKARVRQVVILSSSGGPEASELIPVRGMRTGREIDACKRRVGGECDGLRLDLAKRSDAGRHRKLAHER
jgi:hypothetical protein